MTTKRRRKVPSIRPKAGSVHHIATCHYCRTTIVREIKGRWQHLDGTTPCPTDGDDDGDQG